MVETEIQVGTHVTLAFLTLYNQWSIHIHIHMGWSSVLQVILQW